MYGYQEQNWIQLLCYFTSKCYNKNAQVIFHLIDAQEIYKLEAFDSSQFTLQTL